MKQKTTGKNNKRTLYWFGFIFTMVMLGSGVIDSWLKGGWWIRPIENKWADMRIFLPQYLSFFSKQVDFTSSIGRYYNRRADERVTIIAIDEHTVKGLGYPFKRKHYATLIEKLNKAGVKAIGVDVLLADSDRDDKASDQRMVNAVRKAGNVAVLVYVNPQTEQLQHPIKGLGEAAGIIAHPHVEGEMEASGQVRRVSLFSPKQNYTDLAIKTRCGKNCSGASLPLLAMGTYAIYKGVPLTELEKRYGTEPKRLNFRVPQDRPLHPAWAEEKDDRMHSSVYRHISVRDIMEDKLSKEERTALNGGIALVGSTALGAFDHYPSPFYTAWPGVELHANVIDNILHDDFLKPVSGLLVTGLMVLAVWLPIMLAGYSIKVISLASAGFISALAGLNFILLIRLYDMPYLSIFIAMLVPFVFVTINKALIEGREKKWIKNTFGQYLSPKVVEVITKDPSKLTLGGEKRDMTAFFLDIAGFTTMSEKMTPEQLTTMLNNYLSGFTDVILKHDGVVDKYIGDCIMAFWNAPLDQKDHRKLACLAAVDCMGEIARLNTDLTQFTIKPSARIGLNSGPMVVGNMGSKMRLSYTVMGDSVNLASRLEGANKFFHSKIMASEYTYDEAKDVVEARSLGQIKVVGKAIPVKVYELLARKGGMDAKLAQLTDAYNEGLEHFYKGSYGKAQKAFKAALAVEPKDGPSAFYLELAEKYAAAAPKDWDGTFNLTSK
ncbi:MAG: adenylate/guanylate cyclase domain-containing protein [Elusimicrobia bacterium]|nr:adenylate/guanylate cyclase domain-containing protein [Elusimicrobiota bacterium]